ncbi:hypothetical protein Pcinc_000668 [Petrolisthes cinctipes]|uniref:Uncharacterized protein n=1 Tax=Petrolisthes cinctipes TaxID=88211 RepID=A0AAE1GPF9_PETCI|nr:hypothetical protein Pcinc_000668 [Petrolisthes cinctipes]
MSGDRSWSLNSCFHHQQAGAGGKQRMDPMNRSGPHSLRLQKAASSWCRAAAKKAVETAANARRLICIALDCVLVKENASRQTTSRHNLRYRPTLECANAKSHCL